MPAGTPAGGLEEQFGALGVVDQIVDVGAPGLGHPRVAAAQVGHAAGPYLLVLVDRRQGFRSGRHLLRSQARLDRSR